MQLPSECTPMKCVIRQDADFYGSTRRARGKFRPPVILPSMAGFVDLDILRQVQTVASVYWPIYFRNSAILIPSRTWSGNKKTSDRFKSPERVEKFSRKPAIAFSNMRIKTQNNNMVNKAFERTADFRHFDIAPVTFENICLLIIKYVFAYTIYKSFNRRVVYFRH